MILTAETVRQRDLRATAISPPHCLCGDYWRCAPENRRASPATAALKCYIQVKARKELAAVRNDAQKARSLAGGKLRARPRDQDGGAGAACRHRQPARGAVPG